MKTLADVIAGARISAAYEKIDLTEWLFSLSEPEYTSSSKDHITSETSCDEDGRRISIKIQLRYKVKLERNLRNVAYKIYQQIYKYFNIS